MKFIRLNIDYCSYLIITTCVLHFVDGGISQCGQDVVNIEKFTELKISTDGFCSANGGLSCCQSWNGLVQPGLELLFGKTTYIKYNQLNDLIPNIKKSIGDLECHRNSNSAADILTSMDILNDINWIALLNNSFHGNQCGHELTKLLYCSSNYCLYNQTVQSSQNCRGHGHCTTILKNCLTDPFDSLNRNWKQAVGSLTTSLRILAKTQCANDKLALETLWTQLHEWRDPLSWIADSCANYGFSTCYAQSNLLFTKGQEVVKSLANHDVKLQSISSSLQKYWLTQDLSPMQDQDDLIASSSSGSGWNINEQFTDDEDLLGEHMYGSGSGHFLDNVEPTFGSDDSLTISSTSSPPPSSPNSTKPSNTKSSNNVSAGSSSRSLQFVNLYSFILLNVLLLHYFINPDYLKL
ncbi:unnamed protein product [Allacma fusca]|uniref:Uncharacterized protein n=1 Tax=Allacma fusca TaxID=39272 RepID=A0A8J2Q4R4_9HEXA|nr:unnamed protein product [Allacma fusca]